MDIVINLSKTSIEKAKRQLRKAKRDLNSMLDLFLERCCNWFIMTANDYVYTSHRGINVEQDIENSWVYSVKNGYAVITNYSDKAVFVEFGVGLLGEQNPHPNAEITGYEYNMTSDSKFKSYNGEDWWIFKLKGGSTDDLDLYPEDYLVKSARSGLYFVTKGSWGAMFAHRTIVDMAINKGVIESLWQEVKEIYWGN